MQKNTYKIHVAHNNQMNTIIQLRHKILHPNGPLNRVIYNGDKETSTTHLIAMDSLKIIACGTLIAENEQEQPSSTQFRIRGMAVAKSYQGKGLGTLILHQLIEQTKKQKGSSIWCNARVPALNLYLKYGFHKISSQFDIPGGGPHFRLKLIIDT